MEIVDQFFLLALEARIGDAASLIYPNYWNALLPIPALQICAELFADDLCALPINDEATGILMMMIMKNSLVFIARCPQKTARKIIFWNFARFDCFSAVFAGSSPFPRLLLLLDFACCAFSSSALFPSLYCSQTLFGVFLGRILCYAGCLFCCCAFLMRQTLAVHVPTENFCCRSFWCSRIFWVFYLLWAEQFSFG